MNIPEAEVHISPELVILHTKERSELDGELHIPYGRIRPRELPKSAVTGTSDLVVVGRDAPQQEEPADPNFHSRLRIIIGDRVSFEGFGLRANLTGNLLVIDEPGRPVIGRGRLGVTDGTYRAYGQDLKIERGYVLFADSPVDNPGVDVRAVREAGEVTAGLRVSELVSLADKMISAGASALLIEGTAREVAAIITQRVAVPVISCGSGPDCDGQILIISDVLGLCPSDGPKFAKNYANLAPEIVTAVKKYSDQVKSADFPDDDHCYHIKPGELEKLRQILG